MSVYTVCARCIWLPSAQHELSFNMFSGVLWCAFELGGGKGRLFFFLTKVVETEIPAWHKQLTAVCAHTYKVLEVCHCFKKAPFINLGCLCSRKKYF